MRRKSIRAMSVAALLVCGLAVAKEQSPAGPVAGSAVSEVLLQTTRSWDGETYQPYLSGQPQISVLRIYIPPHSALAWHRHPVINAAYVLTGKLFVEKKSNGMKREVNAGEVLPEMVDDPHRGYTEDQSATLLVFYAGVEGVPITVSE
jgi:quercetin dioxygenase-like cupin family protein